MTDKILTHLRDVQMLMNAGQLLPAGRSLTAAIAGMEKMAAERDAVVSKSASTITSAK